MVRPVRHVSQALPIRPGLPLSTGCSMACQGKAGPVLAWPGLYCPALLWPAMSRINLDEALCFKFCTVLCSVLELAGAPGLTFMSLNYLNGPE